MPFLIKINECYVYKSYFYLEKKCLHLIYKLLKRKIKFPKFDFEIFFKLNN